MIHFKQYAVVSGLNSGLLLIGAVVGTILSGLTHAQPQPSPKSTVTYEEIVPDVTWNAGAFGTVLARRVVSDQLIVRGIDLVTFYENTLNLMARNQSISAAELKAALDSARVVPLPRMKRPGSQNPLTCPRKTLPSRN